YGARRWYVEPQDRKDLFDRVESHLADACPSHAAVELLRMRFGCNQQAFSTVGANRRERVTEELRADPGSDGGWCDPHVLEVARPALTRQHVEADDRGSSDCTEGRL